MGVNVNRRTTLDGDLHGEELPQTAVGRQRCGTTYRNLINMENKTTCESCGQTGIQKETKVQAGFKFGFNLGSFCLRFLLQCEFNMSAGVQFEFSLSPI